MHCGKVRARLRTSTIRCRKHECTPTHPHDRSQAPPPYPCTRTPTYTNPITNQHTQAPPLPDASTDESRNATTLDLEAVAASLKLDLKLETVEGGVGIKTNSGRDRLTSEEDLGGLIETIKGGTTNKAPQRRKRAQRDPCDEPKNPEGTPEQLLDVTAKYRKKLMAKTGGMLTSVKMDASKGDSESLAWSKARLMQSDSENQLNKTNWMIGTGVGNLMEYLDGRSMRIGILPLRTTTETEMETLLSQVHSHFTLTLTLLLTPASTHAFMFVRTCV